MNKELKFSFVMPCYNDGKDIARAIKSILDQDVRNIEVIPVDDGSTDNSKEEIQKMAKLDERVKPIYFEKNQGACVARNEGVKKAVGEFVAFLPADSFLYPGMARIWMDALDENPDHDFVYGGYRITDEEYNHIQGGEYYFQPFDPYLLQVTNYIDGSFPLKREKFWEYSKKMNQPDGLWDKNIKSLQDWDFWLSVVMNGGKGLYIAEIFFETVQPHKGGLSFDSHANWVERTNAIKKKHNIPDRRLCVASIGASWHAHNVAKMLDADFKEMPSFKPHTYDALYLIGFYPEFASQQDQMFFNVASDPSKGKTPAKKVVHFVGSDVWQLYHVSTIHLKFWKDYLKNAVDEVVCESDFIKAELEELGIENVKVVPIPPKTLYKPMPLPKKFTVAVYMPATNGDFYRPMEMEEIAKQCPDTDFKFFGNPMRVGKRKIKEIEDDDGKKVEVYDFQEGKDTNMEDMGYVKDMEAFIKSCSAIIRFPKHDGLPLTVLEFLTAGRNSIQSVPIKHTTCIPNFDIKAIVEELGKLSKVNTSNGEASSYWTKELNHDKYIKTIKDLTEYKPKEYWEKRAESWDTQATDEPWDTKEVKEMLDAVPIDIKSVVDMGCGNGKWYPLLSRFGKYIGFDISKKLISIAQKKYPKGEFRVDTVERSIAKEYDLAFSYTTLEHIKAEDFPKAVESVKKMAKYLLLIEPTDFDSRYYCHNHDYEKHFDVVKKKKLKDKTIFLCKLQ